MRRGEEHRHRAWWRGGSHALRAVSIVCVTGLAITASQVFASTPVARTAKQPSACNGGANVPCHFSTPSGNIRCLWTPRPNNVACELLASRRAYRLRPTGRARRITLNLRRRGDTLPPVQIVVFPDSLSCQDTRTTMTCNQDFGLGAFTLSPRGSHSSSVGSVRARAARIPCRPAPGTFTIAHSAQARIFSDANGNDYACLYGTGRARYLSPAEHYGYRLVRFAGSYVAFTQTIRSGDDHIGAMNMRTGHLRNYQIASPIGSSACPYATALVLKSDGALAWIGTDFAAAYCTSPPGPLIEVRRHDSRGLRILDNQPTIAQHSLHLTGSLLHWVDGGHPRSASLL